MHAHFKLTSLGTRCCERNCSNLFLVLQYSTFTCMLLHLFQDSMPEHKKIWDQWCDGYYLELLNQSLNGIPTPPKPFGEMREAEFNSWLSRIDFAKHNSETEKKFKINPPSKQERC